MDAVTVEMKRDYREDLQLFESNVSLVLAVLLLVAVPAYVLLAAGGFTVYVLTTLAIFVIAAHGMNLLAGYTGQISLGQAAFMAIGAYTHIILYTQGAPLPVSVATGAIVAGAAGALVGLPALRLKGPYLAIATLGFQVGVDQLLGRWDSVTGGRMGLGVPAPELFGVRISSGSVYFVLCFAVAAAVTVGVYNLARSRTGRAFVAIRDNETAAQAMGVDLLRYKTLAFALSALITGLAGALYAHLVDRLNPQHFTLVMSIELLVMVVVGGLASVLGSILGASLLVLLPHVLSELRGYQPIVVGAILIAVLLFEPMGMRGRWLRTKHYFKAWPF
jgi:branched-chain amino acid transport system permease protein